MQFFTDFTEPHLTQSQVTQEMDFRISFSTKTCKSVFCKKDVKNVSNIDISEETNSKAFNNRTDSMVNTDHDKDTKLNKVYECEECKKHF